jgi:arginase
MMTHKNESSSTVRRLALLGVPSSAGARRTGQEGAPAALRAAGLAERLRARGLDVADLGDLPREAFRDDPERPRGRSLERVARVARQTADGVGRAAADHRLPLVLGGDCTITLGVIAGLLRRPRRLGLLYFDGDVDLNTPETTHTGIFDGMVMAHILGRGAPELAGVGPRRPLLSEEEVVLFGYNVESGWIDPPELRALEGSRLTRFALGEIRADAPGAARRARALLEDRFDAFLVHFDVDVMDCPAADVPHPRALDPAAAFAALRVFVASARCAGLVVTELNAESDPDGLEAGRVAGALAEALAGEDGARRETR